MRSAPLRPAAAVSTAAAQPQRYLTNDEAAEYLRLSPRTLEKQRVIGGGPRFRPDGHPKLLHCWPVKLLQAGRGDYAGSEVMIRRAAASLSL